MKHIAAYLLCVLGGNEAPTAEQVGEVITAAGGSVDEAALALLISELEGQSVADLLAKGKESLKSVGSAGPSAGILLYGQCCES
jgi:large subunit ribosomal protein LP2